MYRYTVTARDSARSNCRHLQFLFARHFRSITIAERVSSWPGAVLARTSGLKLHKLASTNAQDLSWHKGKQGLNRPLNTYLDISHYYGEGENTIARSFTSWGECAWLYGVRGHFSACLGMYQLLGRNCGNLRPDETDRPQRCSRTRSRNRRTNLLCQWLRSNNDLDASSR